MEARTKDVLILWKIYHTCVMMQALRMKNDGKVNIYSIPWNARAESWTQKKYQFK